MFTLPKKSRPLSSIVNLNNGEIDCRLVRRQRMQGRLGGGGGRRQLLRAERPPAAAGTATGSGGSGREAKNEPWNSDRSNLSNVISIQFHSF